MYSRVVTLVDMDCFYCQVEARLNPSLKGKPMAVVQYNAWKGGGIIAVNYEARHKGVTRHMRGNEAKNHCPEIELVKVPSVRGKADLTKYRDASREVFGVICEFSECVQRASIDEAYIDLTETVDKRLGLGEKINVSQLSNTFVVGYTTEGNNNEDERASGTVNWLSNVNEDELEDIHSKRLVIGAVIVEEMRAEIYKKTGFSCSAGIAHNKIMAKLVCGLHKPNRQTVLPLSGVSELFSTLPVQKVRSLGGKFGNDVIERLGCKFMVDLSKFSEKDLQAYFDEKTGTWLYNIAKGIDLEPVTPRLVSKSIGCCKKFPGKNCLKTKQDVSHWMNELANEIAERLDEDSVMNKRKAQLLTVSVQQEINKKKTAMSRSVPLQNYDVDVIADVALSAIRKYNSVPSSSDAWIPPLLFLGISVGKFIDDPKMSNKTINQYFNCGNIPVMLNTISNKEDEHVNKAGSNGNTFLNEIHTNEIIRNIKDKVKNDSDFFVKTYKPNQNKEYDKNLHSDKVSITNGYEDFINDISANSSSSCDVNIESKIKNTDINVNFSDKIILEKPSTSSSYNDCGKYKESGTKNYKTSVKETICKKRLTENFNTNESKESSYFNQESCNYSQSIDINLESKHDNNFCTTNTHSNSSQEIYISPSEIFPDVSNIDKDTLSILPSSLQRKIISRTSSNNKNNIKNCDNSGVVSYLKTFEKDVTITNTNKTENTSDFNKIPCKNTTDICNEDRCHLNELKENEVECNSDEIKSAIGNNLFNNHDDDINTDNLKKEKTVSDISRDEYLLESTSKQNTSGKFTNEEDNSEEYLLEICTYCNENVLKMNYQEHIDHHIALKLHSELNSNQSSSSNIIHNSNQTDAESNRRNKGIGKTKMKSPTKRKRQPIKTNTITDNKKCRSILSFFAPK